MEGDEGTIIRYATHENTYLNHIYRQLKVDQTDIIDRDDLLSFIQTVTKSGNDNVQKWEGDRNMVDLCDVVKRFYFDPLPGGSASIKVVLPAVLARSKYLSTQAHQEASWYYHRNPHPGVRYLLWNM